MVVAASLCEKFVGLQQRGKAGRGGGRVWGGGGGLHSMACSCPTCILSSALLTAAAYQGRDEEEEEEGIFKLWLANKTVHQKQFD